MKRRLTKKSRLFFAVVALLLAVFAITLTAYAATDDWTFIDYEVYEVYCEHCGYSSYDNSHPGAPEGLTWFETWNLGSTGGMLSACPTNHGNTHGLNVYWTRTYYQDIYI